MKTLLLLLATAGSMFAATQVVYGPGTIANGAIPDDAFATNTWLRRNVRTDGSIGITTNYARSGNGSAYLATSSGTGKADYEFFFSTPGTLGTLTTLSFDWYRDGTSTNSAVQSPAFRLYYDADGNTATTGDTGYLIYERVYRDAPNNSVPVNSWQTDNLLASNANFWQRAFSPGTTIEIYNRNLSEWQAGPSVTAGGDILSANTLITGMSFGVGSGWAGNFKGAVDNVTIGFNNAEATTYNFEVVPEPQHYAALLVAGLGFMMWRRRVATNQ